MKKHREKSKEHREKTGNFVLLGAWQPWGYLLGCRRVRDFRVDGIKIIYPSQWYIVIDHVQYTSKFTVVMKSKSKF